MTTALLDVRGVHAGHGAAEVLFGIDLAVGPGEIVGVLGRNGMGKTTLVRAIMGLLRPRAGTITLRRPRHHGLGAEPDRARRHRPRARRAPGLRQPERRRAPRSVPARIAPGRDELDAGARARPLPGAGDAALARRQPALGRRAADARDRPRPRDQPRAADPRRSDRRAGAARARGDLARPARSCATPAWR